MNVDIEFEKLKKTILLVAKNQGLSEDYIYKNWHLDYTINQDQEFVDVLSNLKEEIKLFNQAIVKNDLLATKSAIIMAKAYSHILMNFFENINDDIVQLGWGDELKDKWPTIPNDYKIPDYYDYENTNKTYNERILKKESL